MSSAQERLIIDLDGESPQVAEEMVRFFSPYVHAFLLGQEFQAALLCRFVMSNYETEQEHTMDLWRTRSLLGAIGSQLFLDTRWSASPLTIEHAAKRLQAIHPKYLTVQANAGRRAIETAVNHKGTSKILGIAVLDLQDADCFDIYDNSPLKQVFVLTTIAKNAHADGIVCETSDLRNLHRLGGFDEVMKVARGIVPSWARKNQRGLSPKEAISYGADMLIIGRKDLAMPVSWTAHDCFSAIIEEIESVPVPA